MNSETTSISLTPQTPVAISFMTTTIIIIITLIAIITTCTLLAFIISLLISKIHQHVYQRFARLESDVEIPTTSSQQNHQVEIEIHHQTTTYETAFGESDRTETVEMYDVGLLPNYMEVSKETLRQKALEKLVPSVSYGSESSFDECPICLDEFGVGELCRVFPVCCHWFHVKCIDVWLRNHSTCPVCRRCLSDLCPH